MHTCTLTATLRSIVETLGLVVPPVQRLLVVEDEGPGKAKLKGIVTTYDLLEYICSSQ